MYLQEKGKVEVGVVGGEGGKFMCSNITVPILHTAVRLLQNIAIKYNSMGNFFFRNSNNLHLVTFDPRITCQTAKG